MKLAYRDVPAPTPGRPVIVLHDRGAASADKLAALARASGAVGRMVVPFGDYGFTASGMELAGICWYRTVPGYDGADPLTLAKAVVQAGDLLDDVDLDRPALLGWGQGGVVALGVALLRPEQVASVVCIDVEPSHLRALPSSLTAPASPPPVLVVSSIVGDGARLERVGEGLDYRGMAASRWGRSDQDGDEDEGRDKAVAERIGRWLGDG